MFLLSIDFRTCTTSVRIMVVRPIIGRLLYSSSPKTVASTSAAISHLDIFAQRQNFPGMRVPTVPRVKTHAHTRYSCFCTTHGVRLACARNKGGRVCVGGGGRVELGDDELLETCGERGNQVGLCSYRKIWPFHLKRPAPA